MDIIMDARGGNTPGKQRGLEAAQAVLDREGMTADEAASGSFAVEGWDDMGFPPDQEPSEEEYAGAEVWWAASNAAIEACCADGPTKEAPGFGLQLTHDPESQFADRVTALCAAARHYPSRARQ